MAEHFCAEHVSDNFLGLAVQVGVRERHVVVGSDTVTEGGEAVITPLHDNGIRKGVFDVLHFLVRRRVGQQQPLVISDTHAPDDARARYRGVDHWDMVGKLGLEEGVEIFRPADGHQSICICQRAEHTNVITILKLTTDCHFRLVALACLCAWLLFVASVFVGGEQLVSG